MKKLKYIKDTSKNINYFFIDQVKSLKPPVSFATIKNSTHQS